MARIKRDPKTVALAEEIIKQFNPKSAQDVDDAVNYSNEDLLNFISIIRLPDFVTKKDFDWVKEVTTRKKKIDRSKAEFLVVKEGLCV